MTNKKYICEGENFKDGFRVGFCGKVHTLKEWLEILYGQKGVEYFEGSPDKVVTDYLFKNAGKRLRTYKNRF